MSYLVHAANVLYLASYFGRDALRLRLCTVIATLCLIPYFYFRPQPLIAAICWNAFFASMNAYWVLRLVRERRGSSTQKQQATKRDLSRAFYTTETFVVARMDHHASI